MDKIISYKLCLKADSMLLSEQVDEFVKAGFEPFGSPFCSMHDNAIYFGQATVLREGVVLKEGVEYNG